MSKKSDAQPCVNLEFDNLENSFVKMLTAAALVLFLQSRLNTPRIKLLPGLTHPDIPHY